jgi:DNA-binding winged helix-turn-helix (wHTH) protein/Flp pilus assembly protein TadD
MSGGTDHQTAIKEQPEYMSGFRLGMVDVEPATGTVSGPGGSAHLDPRVMDVLVCLVKAGGEVVSRETLMNEVWGDAVVTDFALSRCIYQLRKNLALAANSDDKAIETLSKRGYRLRWPVGDSVPKETGHGRQHRSTAAFVAGMVLILLVVVFFRNYQDQPSSVEERSPGVEGEEVRLVVFPFVDVSDNQDQQVFATGLAREILHELAVVSGLSLVGKRSSFNSEPGELNTLDHAQLLEADFLLEGTVQTIGPNRRVLVDLYTVPDGEQLWSHSILLEQDVPFNHLREVAWKVAQLLQFSMDPDYIQSSTDRLDAFELYLLAFVSEDINVQRNLLQQVVTLDPDYARAWESLAAIEVMPVWNGETTVEEAWERSRPYVEKALEIDPGLADAYVTLGRFKREFGEFEEAIEMFQKALELDPGNRWASANLGLVLRFTGRLEESLDIFKLDVALDPLDSYAHARLGTSQWLMENHEEAFRQYRKAAELDPDNEETYDSWSAMLALGMGRFDLALDKMHQKMDVEGQPTPRTFGASATWAAVLGLDQLADQYVRLARGSDPADASLIPQPAVRYLERGEDTAARSQALLELKDSESNTDAHLVLGALQLEAGKPDHFLQRVQRSFPNYQVPETKMHLMKEMDTVLLIAAANHAGGLQETAMPLLNAVVGVLDKPRSREHFWLAAAHAMRGETDLAMSELRVSPPGWIRRHARFMLRDPRFLSLHDLPEFQTLVTEHLEELDRQRELFLETVGETVGSESGARVITLAPDSDPGNDPGT